MSTMADSRSWWELAACRAADPELFFPVTEAGPAKMQVARAKGVCAQCQVRRECLDFAVATRQGHGIWGGMSQNERRLLRAAVAS